MNESPIKDIWDEDSLSGLKYGVKEQLYKEEEKKLEKAIEEEESLLKQRLREKWNEEYRERACYVEQGVRYYRWADKHPEEARGDRKERTISRWGFSICSCVGAMLILSLIALFVNDLILKGFYHAGFPDMTISDPLFKDVFSQEMGILGPIFGPPLISFFLYAWLEGEYFNADRRGERRFPQLVWSTVFMCLIIWGVEIRSNFFLPTMFFLSFLVPLVGPLLFYVLTIKFILPKQSSSAPYKNVTYPWEWGRFR